MQDTPKIPLRVDLPVLPLRDVVVYPHMVIPLFVGRDRSIKALDLAMAGDKQILLVAQKNPAVDDPDDQDLYRVGTVATVLQLLKLPDGTVKVLVEGEQRGTIERFIELDDHCRAEVQLIEEGETAERDAWRAAVLEPAAPLPSWLKIQRADIQRGGDRHAGAAAVHTAVLIDKDHQRKARPDLKADYVGLSCIDRYIFGYGMDYKGYWRNAAGIFAVKGL